MRQAVYHLLVVSIMICLPSNISHAKPIIGANIHRVFGGRFPFIVAIKKVNSGQGPLKSYLCAGTLISKKHVLTAAHCVENFLPIDLEVCVGSINLKYCSTHEIRTWDIYETWAWQKRTNNVLTEDRNSDEEDYDVAIITLANEVTDPDARPANILPRGVEMPWGSKVDVAGWGQSNEGYPTFLQTANVELKGKDECNMRMEKYPHFYPLVSTEFCTATEPYILLGSGDSGGPVIYNDDIIGVNKAGCQKDIPLKDHINIHTNVEAFRNFIDEVLSRTE